MKNRKFAVFVLLISMNLFFLSCTVNFSVSGLPDAAPLASTTLETPSITWNKTYAETNLWAASSIIQAMNGGFMLGGTTRSSNSTPSAVELLKVDSLGNPEWNKTYLGTANPLGKWLVQTSEGGYAFAGQYNGSCWLAKVDDEGNMEWNKTYSGTGISTASALAQTIDGGYALSGYGTGAGIVWLMKTNSRGDAQWNNTLGAGIVYSVIQTSDGGYALAGGVGDLPDFLLIKTNSTGHTEWRATYGSPDKDFSYSVIQTEDGGFASAGWMWSRENGGGLNLGIVKSDPLGNMQWTKYYGAGQAWALTKTVDSGFIVAGTALAKVDALGNEQWMLNLNDNNTIGLEGTIVQNQVYSIIQTSDGGYTVAGTAVFYGGITAGWAAKINVIAIANPTDQVSPSSPTIAPSTPSTTVTPTTVPTVVSTNPLAPTCLSTTTPSAATASHNPGAQSFMYGAVLALAVIIVAAASVALVRVKRRRKLSS